MKNIVLIFDTGLIKFFNTTKNNRTRTKPDG